MRKKVFLPAPMLNPVGEEVLRKDVELIEGRDLDAGGRAAALAEAHGVCGTGMSAEEMDAAPHLEVIGFPGSGFESIDTRSATERGITVVYAAGSQYTAVAEHALGLMISVSKRIGYTDRYFHERKQYLDRPVFMGDGWPGWPHEIGGKTVGVLGFGFIGRDIARKCRAGFDMQVLAYDPYYDQVEAERQGVELIRRRSELPELMSRSDFVVLSLPLSEETRHIVGEPELRAMRRDAYLINVSRGGTVDEAALVRALREGRIAGAGIDVFEQEPAQDGHALYDMDHVVLSPHIAGWVEEAMPRLATTVAREMLCVLRGERPNRMANPEVWGAPNRRARG